MTDCPICERDFKELRAHIEEEHPDYMPAVMAKEREIKPVPKVVSKSWSDVVASQKKMLIEQNELLLLQIQQKSLIDALRGTPERAAALPQPPAPNNNLRETLALIREVRETFPQVEGGGDNDILIEALRLGGAYLAQKNANSGFSGPLPSMPITEPETELQNPPELSESLPDSQPESENKNEVLPDVDTEPN